MTPLRLKIFLLCLNTRPAFVLGGWGKAAAEVAGAANDAYGAYDAVTSGVPIWAYILISLFSMPILACCWVCFSESLSAFCSICCTENLDSDTCNAPPASTMLKVMCRVMVEDGQADEAQISMIQELFQQFSELEISKEDVLVAAEKSRQSGSIEDDLGENPKGNIKNKDAVIFSMLKVALASGDISELETDLIVHTAVEVLGMGIWSVNRIVKRVKKEAEAEALSRVMKQVAKEVEAEAGSASKPTFESIQTRLTSSTSATEDTKSPSTPSEAPEANQPEARLEAGLLKITPEKESAETDVLPPNKDIADSVFKALRREKIQLWMPPYFEGGRRDTSALEQLAVDLLAEIPSDKNEVIKVLLMYQSRSIKKKSAQYSPSNRSA